jgi:hypothetical protein
MKHKKQLKSTVEKLKLKSEQIFKDTSQYLNKTYKSYSPKIKREMALLSNKALVSVKHYTPIMQAFVAKYTRIYGRKTKEAFIAFRKNYEPVIKAHAHNFGNKTIDFANELKKKIRK